MGSYYRYCDNGGNIKELAKGDKRMNRQSEDADTGKEIKELQAQALELMVQLTDEQIKRLLSQYFSSCA